MGYTFKKKQKRWVLEIRDKGELIAKDSTGHPAPEGLKRLGEKTKTSLERGGRLG